MDTTVLAGFLAVYAGRILGGIPGLAPGRARGARSVRAVFLAVYAGMILGGIPGLALDRAGVALLGAIALVAFGKVTVAEAWASLDVPTMTLLLGLMVVSAQFRLGGFFAGPHPRE